MAGDRPKRRPSAKESAVRRIQRNLRGGDYRFNQAALSAAPTGAHVRNGNMDDALGVLDRVRGYGLNADEYEDLVRRYEGAKGCQALKFSNVTRLSIASHSATRVRAGIPETNSRVFRAMLVLRP